MKKGLPLPPIVMEADNRSPQGPKTSWQASFTNNRASSTWPEEEYDWLKLFIHQIFTQLEPPHLPHPHQAHHPPASRSKMCTGYQWDGWRFPKDIMRWCETYGNEIRWVHKNFKQSHATKPCHHFPTNDPAAALSILLVSKCLKQSLLSYLDAQLLPPAPTIWSCTNGFVVILDAPEMQSISKDRTWRSRRICNWLLITVISQSVSFEKLQIRIFFVPWTVPCYLRSACKFHKGLQVLLVSLWPHHCSKSSPSTWPIWDGLLNQLQTLDLKRGTMIAMATANSHNG